MSAKMYLTYGSQFPSALSSTSFNIMKCHSFKRIGVVKELTIFSLSTTDENGGKENL